MSMNGWTQKDIDGKRDVSMTRRRHIDTPYGPVALPSLGPKPSKSKYHAVRATSLNGRSYSSKIERDRGDFLELLQKAGAIVNLKYQPRYFLSMAQISYHADFEYKERRGNGWVTIAEDVKGIETDRFRIIKRLWLCYGECPLRIVKRQGSVWQSEELRVKA